MTKNKLIRLLIRFAYSTHFFLGLVLSFCFYGLSEYFPNLEIPLIAVLCLIIAIVSFLTSKEGKKIITDNELEVKSTAKESKQTQPSSYDDENKSEINPDTFKAFIPNCSEEEFTGLLYEIYVNIQKSLVNFDLITLRGLTTDELFNTYRTILEILKIRNGKNIKDGFVLCDIYITDIRKMNKLLAVDVSAVIEYFDYVIDTDSGNVVRGNKYNKVACNYKMTFIGSPAYSIENICPNCGAGLGESHSSICQYCGSIAVNTLHTWVLSNAKIVSLVPQHINHFFKRENIVEIDSDTINRYIPNYDKRALGNLLFNTYKEIQNSWAKADLSKIEDLACDELFNTYQTQDKFLQYNSNKKVKMNIRLHSILIVDIKERENSTEIVTDVIFECCDDTINTKTGESILGYKTQRTVYNYTLSFIYDENKRIKLSSKKLINKIKK